MVLKMIKRRKGEVAPNILFTEYHLPIRTIELD